MFWLRYLSTERPNIWSKLLPLLRVSLPDKQFQFFPTNFLYFVSVTTELTWIAKNPVLSRLSEGGFWKGSLCGFSICNVGKFESLFYQLLCHCGELIAVFNNCAAISTLVYYLLSVIPVKASSGKTWSWGLVPGILHVHRCGTGCCALTPIPIARGVYPLSLWKLFSALWLPMMLFFCQFANNLAAMYNIGRFNMVGK